MSSDPILDMPPAVWVQTSHSLLALGRRQWPTISENVYSIIYLFVSLFIKVYAVHLIDTETKCCQPIDLSRQCQGIKMVDMCTHAEKVFRKEKPKLKKTQTKPSGKFEQSEKFSLV